MGKWEKEGGSDQAEEVGVGNNVGSKERGPIARLLFKARLNLNQPSAQPLERISSGCDSDPHFCTEVRVHALRIGAGRSVRVSV